MHSQNLLFVGESPGDDRIAPAGRGIARRIYEALCERGRKVGAFDNWRDCGWSFEVSLGDAIVQVSLVSTMVPRLWMLQVACINQPRLIARLFGAKVVDRTSEIFDVATEVHDTLEAVGYSEMRWCIDGYPDHEVNSPEPRRS